MKKLLKLALVMLTLVMIFSALSCTAFASDKDFSYSLKNGQATITGYSGKAVTLVIPETLDGKPVCAIADNAFYRTKVKAVIVPEDIYISEDAFPEGTKIFQGEVNPYEGLKPSATLIEELGDEGKIVKPGKKSYLSECEIMRVDAPKGHSVYVYWKSEADDDAKRSRYAYQDDMVAVLARENGFSCIICANSNDHIFAGWVCSDFLVSVSEDDDADAVESGKSDASSAQSVYKSSDCKTMLMDMGENIQYPKDKSYLSECELMYVDAPKGHSTYVYWAPKASSDYKRSHYAYQGDEVIVVARENGMSCVICTNTNGNTFAGWIMSEYLKQDS